MQRPTPPTTNPSSSISSTSATSQVWGGRFSSAPTPDAAAFTASIKVDHRLWPHDIDASLAHAEMLASVGLITAAEGEELSAGLQKVAARLAAGILPFSDELEDIHMHIEAALIAELGDTGRKLHTARSRNDQVATSLRLWTRSAIDQICDATQRLQSAFVAAAVREADVVMPGYTHLQRAQPVLAAHSFLAHVERLERDRSRLLDARVRVNVLPLGSAALAGTSLPIDREQVRRRLGFHALAMNSMDATSDRDFVAETLFALSLLATHLSSFAEEWILWNTAEFSFISLPDALCTGSSIMPQKKNPDTLELIRGRTARVIGALQTSLVLLKGLPLAYNRDLQEDKPALFDAVDTVLACLAAATAVVAGARLRADVIAAKLDQGFLDATTAMEALIATGVPMRTAHELLGRLVATAERAGVPLGGLPLETLAAAHPLLGERASQLFGVHNAIDALRSPGSSGRGAVAASIDRWREILANRTKGDA